MLSNLKIKVISLLLSIILLVLPLNTVLVQFFVVKLGLPVWLSLWKELLAATTMVLIILDLIPRLRLKKSWLKFHPLILIVTMTIVGFINSIGKVGLNFVIYGFRFELFWVWFWVLLAIYAKLYFFSKDNQKLNLTYSKYLLNSLLSGYVLVSVFCLITIILGSESVLSALGYGLNATQAGSELLFTQTAGHLIDAGGWNSNFRLSGTFSSPNHFAAYLILLLPLFLTGVISNKKILAQTWFEKFENKYFWSFLLILNLSFMILTFARYSYLALFVIVAVLIELWIYKKVVNLSHRTENKKNKLTSSIVSRKFLNLVKNLDLVIIFVTPILISLVVLNLPVSILQANFPTWLAKPSSTEWHQQHTAATWRAITYQTHPQILQQNNLTTEKQLLITNLQGKHQDELSVAYRLLTGYGMGTTDPASKYLPLEQNPMVKSGIGIDDELYFPRNFDRPLALTPENWFLGLGAKGGIFYMFAFLAIIIYFCKDLKLLFLAKTEILQNPFFLLKVLLSISMFGLAIGATLLDIFDSQSLALLIGPIYFSYLSIYERIT